MSENPSEITERELDKVSGGQFIEPVHPGDPDPNVLLALQHLMKKTAELSLERHKALQATVNRTRK